jgi:Spy/CpxP family protein refolding chaperone
MWDVTMTSMGNRPIYKESVMKTSHESSGAIRRGGKAWVMGVVLAVSGTAAMSVWAAAPGSHDWRGGPRGGPEMMLGTPEHPSRALDHMLAAVKATDAQKAQIRQIAAAAAKDLQPQREQGRKLHEQGAKLLTAPTIDAAAVESVRAQGQALRDQASRRVTQALVDIGNVLTPEQRVQLADLHAKRAQKMRDHRQNGASQPAKG